MNIIQYLKDRSLFLVLNAILFIIIVFISIAFSISFDLIIILFIIWFTPITIYIIFEFIKFNKYYSELNRVCENLDRKYLLSEVIQEPNFIEGKIVYNILKDTNRSMRESINYYKHMQNEYQEYIEAWVHEIKTPIASTMLTIDNNIETIPYRMKNEVQKIEDYVEQVLYYSRSNDVSKDYIIKEFELELAVRKVIRRNASDFIHKKISIDIQDINKKIYSDLKWVEFIINQIISNAIKYSKDTDPKLTINSYENENGIILTITDNGIGIIERDLSRVFEKGFTGENGRKLGKSTGMGLYICSKLCNKLNLGIDITSKLNEGTTIKLIFPRYKDKELLKL